jgi:uncharacterized membrane protein
VRRDTSPIERDGSTFIEDPFAPVSKRSSHLTLRQEQALFSARTISLKMPDEPGGHRFMSNRFLRQFQARPRIMVAIVIALALFFLLPDSWPGSTRTIAALDAGGLLFLVSSWVMMARSTERHMRLRAAMEDEGQLVVLTLTAGAALFSLVTVAIELHALKDLPPGGTLAHVGLAAGTILCSWFVTHTMFALHYAHGFYIDPDPTDDKQDTRGGLDIPGCPHPDYWDFLYFSFTIGMTFQTSDVQITSRSLRRQTLAHAVLSFFFNTVILALSVNIAAGLL